MFISKKSLTKLENKARKLGVRERILLTVLGVVLVFFIWQKVVMQKIENSSKRLLSARIQVEQENIILQDRFERLSQEAEQKKVKLLTARIGGLKTLNKTLEAEIVSLTKNLIPPGEMLKLLQDILEQTDTVKVINLKNLMETEFFSSKANLEEVDEDGEQVKLEIYKHGIEIDLEATYLGVMQFLYKLEKLKWNLIWDSFEYEVIDFPKSRAKLIVYTLSLSDNWINL